MGRAQPQVHPSTPDTVELARQNFVSPFSREPHRETDAFQERPKKVTAYPLFLYAYMKISLLWCLISSIPEESPKYKKSDYYL